MKDFGVQPYLFPMPTYMIGTYNEDDTVDVMMMAWGGICAEDMVALNLEADHKTVANIRARKAFTLAIPGTDTLKESDFLGIATSNKMADKFERTGLRVLGKILNVLADEKVLDEKGKIDAGKIQAFAFDQMQNGYYAIGEKVGQAWHSGAELMKK